MYVCYLEQAAPGGHDKTALNMIAKDLDTGKSAVGSAVTSAVNYFKAAVTGSTAVTVQGAVKAHAKLAAKKVYLA